MVRLRGCGRFRAQGLFPSGKQSLGTPSAAGGCGGLLGLRFAAGGKGLPGARGVVVVLQQDVSARGQLAGPVQHATGEHQETVCWHAGPLDNRTQTMSLMSCMCVVWSA